MWLQPKTDLASEPIELRDLKLKLAKLSCKCLKNRSKSVIPKIADVHTLKETNNDKAVQAEHRENDQFHCEINKVNPVAPHKDSTTMVSFNKDHLCPGCYITMSLLKGRPFKILKDQESETKAGIFSRDKSTENRVDSVEKTTSITSKLGMYSHLSILDSKCTSECSSELSLREHDEKRSHNVKFIDVPVNTQPEDITLTGACFCLENFMDAIRPSIYF